MPSVIQGQETKEEAGGAAVCRQRLAAVDCGRAPPDLLSSTTSQQQASYVADSQGLQRIRHRHPSHKFGGLNRWKQSRFCRPRANLLIHCLPRRVERSIHPRGEGIHGSENRSRGRSEGIPTWLCGARWFFCFGVRYGLRTLLMVRDRKSQIRVERRVCVMG